MDIPSLKRKRAPSEGNCIHILQHPTPQKPMAPTEPPMDQHSTTFDFGGGLVIDLTEGAPTANGSSSTAVEHTGNDHIVDDDETVGADADGGDEDEDDDDQLTRDEVDQLFAQLRREGMETFEHKTLPDEDLDLESFALAVGIDPDWAEEEGLDYVDYARNYLHHLCHKRAKLPHVNTMDDVVNLLKSSSKVLVITGAGISTSLGIPDFRSKDGGFYAKLRDLGMAEPEEVFDIFNFDHDPSVFYSLAADILPMNDAYTPTHDFIRRLQDKGKLLRNYTQNIDNIERLAGISSDRLLQCHGSFATASCRKCKHQVPGKEIFGDIRGKRVAKCRKCIDSIAATASVAKVSKPKPKARDFDGGYDDDSEPDDLPSAGVMKPDITFFGEALPDTFFKLFAEDKKVTDLVLVIGTSMQVGPVAEMPDALAEAGRGGVPVVYVGREACRHIEFDVQVLGECDEVVGELGRRAGWKALKGQGDGADSLVKLVEVGENLGVWRLLKEGEKADEEEAKIIEAGVEVIDILD
ncbi:hypothetical protein B0A48_02797 [Cryoendolithus antarcticus]|uniref:Deacetylase sirtuin-type domain-containing protein n=1 Tax=Cryoendolithus antarcticus TaxID=1507870 RepID=A0A1V8TLA8_9PEZI|nr:hypothetical protein B0A48_02797 [Cryoendolithus antarcticus]